MFICRKVIKVGIFGKSPVPLFFFKKLSSKAPVYSNFQENPLPSILIEVALKVILAIVL